MLDDYDALCELTHPEKKDGDDSSKASTELSAVTNGAQEGDPGTALVEAS